MALGLVLFGVLDLAYSVVTFIHLLFWGGRETDSTITVALPGTVTLTIPGTFVVLWFAAWLVWRDKRIVWPIIAYLGALGLGVTAGGALAVGLSVPIKLLRAMAMHDRWDFICTSTYLAAQTALLVWLVIEAHRVDWGTVPPRPRRRWLRPAAVGAYAGVLCTAIGVAIVHLATGPWTKPVIERARKQLGPEYANYDYYVSSYSFHSTKGHTTHQAVVVAYSETEYNWIKLNWEN